MLHYGGPTPKPHVAWSNSYHVASLYMGKLVGWAKKKRELADDGKAPHGLVVKYVDKAGKQRYKGSQTLRASELGSQFPLRRLVWCMLLSNAMGQVEWIIERIKTLYIGRNKLL